MRIFSKQKNWEKSLSELIPYQHVRNQPSGTEVLVIRPETSDVKLQPVSLRRKEEVRINYCSEVWLYWYAIIQKNNLRPTRGDTRKNNEIPNIYIYERKTERGFRQRETIERESEIFRMVLYFIEISDIKIPIPSKSL